MTPDDIVSLVLGRYPGTVEVASWGERSVFLNPDGALARGVYFLTIKERDGPNDRASRLDRPDAFRVNFGVDRTSYERLFGPVPGRPAKGGVVATGHDFAAADALTPHPVYGGMGWVSVVSPSAETFERLAPLVDEAYDMAQSRLERRTRARGRGGA